MTLFNKYRIETARLKEWNYSNNAAYFVTICTKEMVNYFGKIKDDKVLLSDAGKIVEEEWLNTKQMRDNVILDEFIVMPNHLHGIIVIMNEEEDIVETHRVDFEKKIESPKASLPNIIKGFKAAASKRICNSCYSYFKWQTRYYDHIIRNEKAFDNIREYIYYNPLRWNLDEYYKE